jgi:adenylate kinase family enzyme
MLMYTGGPGSGKATQCIQLVERYPGWVHLSMGDLLRQNILNKKGGAGDKWNLIGDLMQHGEMAPEVRTTVHKHLFNYN